MYYFSEITGPTQSLAQNIFYLKLDNDNFLSQSGTGLISLDEFYRMVNRKHSQEGEQGVQEEHEHEEQIAVTKETET